MTADPATDHPGRMRQYPPRRKHTIKVTLSDAERREVESYAARRGLSLANAFRLALLAYVERENTPSRAA